MTGVYVTAALPHDILSPLRDRFATEVWVGAGPVPRQTLEGVVRDVEGLLCMITENIDERLLSRAPNLRVVSQMAVGVDNIDLEACRRRGIRVGHTPGVLTETVADTAFALLCSIVRRLPEGEKVVRRGEWGPWSPDFLNGRVLHGTTLGIVGMGRIGRSVARRARGFDMEIVYTSRSSTGDDLARRLDLDELLETANHVVLTVALTPETHHLISTRELIRMRPEAYLVNVSRGPVVDTGALVAALRAGEIAGAALDVTDPEPLPRDHPLLDLPNCLVVPHIASSSLETRADMARLAVQNLIAGLDGYDLPAAHGP